MFQQSFDQVWWLGGSPCAGKSSIASVLAQRYRCQVYSADQELGRHQPYLTAEKQPTLYKWTHTRWHDLWMQSQETLLAEAIAAYTEHFRLVLRDLVSTTPGAPLLVEGTCLLPGLVADVLDDPRHALWMVPTEDFQREVYPKRGQWVQDILADCDSPQLALRNWMDRDTAFAHWIVQSCTDLGLIYVVVDGRRSVEDYAHDVARHFDMESV